MFKICAHCKIEKTAKDFRKDRSRGDGFNIYCKPCSRTHQQSLYTQRYSKKENLRSKERFAKVKAFLYDYKRTHPCVCCPESNPICLDLHHIDPSQKDFTVSQGQNRSFEKIQEEINKCVIVCRNCHAKIHAGEIQLSTAES